MSEALNKTGRKIHFNMCEWGQDDPWKWGPSIAQSWRATGDHTGTWSSAKSIIQSSAKIPAQYTGKPYSWNDLDMLETGNYEQAAHANGKESNMTATEYKTEFTMWAIQASPLIVTTPIMNCTAQTIKKCELSKLSLKKQLSHDLCTSGKSFGCSDTNGSMWTDDGCRGDFAYEGANDVSCNVNGNGKHSCDITNGPVKCMPWISDLQKEILFNDEVIAINQDITPQGRPVTDGDLTLWTRKLSDGTVAVALYNENDTPQSIGFNSSAIGFGSSVGFAVRDLWAHKDLGDFNTGVFAPIQVAPHEAVALRVKKTA